MGRFFAVVGLAALLLTAGLISQLSAGAATRNVDVRDNSFADGISGTSTTTIAAGDTVQWNWSGSNPHTVDNNGGSESFSSGAPQTTGSFSHTFNTAGTYSYICGVHGTSMQGTVVVQAAQAPTSTPVPPSTSTPVPQSSSTASAIATPTNTPVQSTTAPAAAATSSAGVAATSTTAAPATSTPAAQRGGALPSTGHGPTDVGRQSGWQIAVLIFAMIGAGGFGGLALARRVSR